MKKTILLFSGILINVSAFSQNPTVQSIINSIRIDSLKQTVRQLSGEIPVMVGSTTYTLNTRHAMQPDNEIAFQLLKQKLLSYGLQPDSAAVHTSTVANSLFLSTKLLNINSLYNIGLKLRDVVNPTSGTSDHRSFWVNKQQIIKNKFEWQDEYIALSVSYSAIDKVKAYILNQEEHHQKKTFAQEYDEFLNAHHFETVLAKANANSI